MIPNFPVFKELDYKLYKDLSAYIEKFKPNSCEFCLGNLYAWREVFKTEVTLMRGNLCILFHDQENGDFFIEPLGEKDIIETIKDCLDYCRQMFHVRENLVNQLELSTNYRVIEAPEYFEYLYFTSELAEFKGTAFHSKRNHISKFKKAHPEFKNHLIISDDRDRVGLLFDQWSLKRMGRGTIKKVSSAALKQAIIGAFDHFSRVPFMGNLVESHGEDLGFIIGSPLNKNTIVVHFQCGLSHVPGIYQILLQEFCSRVQEQFRYINLEQDSAVAGLRKMKLSYHPCKIEKYYKIIQEQ
jgi:hypothetical protein